MVSSRIAASSSFRSIIPLLCGAGVGHFEAFALQLTAGIQNRFMLGFAGDDVLAFFLIKVGCTLDRRGCRIQSHQR